MARKLSERINRLPGGPEVIYGFMRLPNRHWVAHFLECMQQVMPGSSAVNACLVERQLDPHRPVVQNLGRCLSDRMSTGLAMIPVVGVRKPPVRTLPETSVSETMRLSISVK